MSFASARRLVGRFIRSVPPLRRTGQRLRLTRRVAELREVLGHLIEFLDQKGLEHWPTEGNLIGALRYGALHGELSKGLVNLVDDDIDWMVRVSGKDDWFDMVSQLIPIFEGMGFQETRLWAGKKILTFRRHSTWWHTVTVDLHSYVRRGGRISCPEFEPDSTGITIPALFPFQATEGSIDEGVVVPLAKCRLYQHGVPCPFDPIQLLRLWNNGEYTRGNLALPDLDRRPAHDPSAPGPDARRITESDISRLTQYSTQLDRDGFRSMISLLGESTVPSPSSTVTGQVE